MQDVGDFTHTSGFFDWAGNRTGLKQLGQNIHNGFLYGAGLIPEEAGPTPMPDGDEDKGAQTKAETDKAAAEAAGAGAGAERESANTAKESGVNAARAGNMAGANSAQALTNGLYQAGAAQNAATQADYRDKIAQADIMDTQAGNMAKGAKLMPWAAGLQGLGQGFMLGMGLLSDENSKEAPADGIDDDKLKEAIEQFKSLYAQLQEIKKCQQ